MCMRKWLELAGIISHWEQGCGRVKGLDAFENTFHVRVRKEDTGGTMAEGDTIFDFHVKDFHFFIGRVKDKSSLWIRSSWRLLVRASSTGVSAITIERIGGDGHGEASKQYVVKGTRTCSCYASDSISPWWAAGWSSSHCE